MASLVLFLEEGPFRVGVDPNFGGHIIEYSINGKNSLVENKPAIGSTFWPSPQSTWGWPPLHALDKGPYFIVSDGKGDDGRGIVVRSAVCQQTGLQVEKRFHLRQGRLTVTYVMSNQSEVAVQYAPWEISRVEGGITFYASMLAPLPQSTGKVQSIDGVYWHTYHPEQMLPNAHEKVFANGSTGWLANVNKGLLLVKQFEPVPAELTAPGEAEVEIYSHADVFNSYIEVEQQGSYEVIPPGAAIEWQVVWHLTEWNDDTVQPGDSRLVHEVKALLSDYKP
ncbi:DUF4380 domain-containing protein [Saccharophagus sp. K07]|jgi:hypothetical protein|uniref:DUF4380 domain-containing protein n=1 Tax=Saccharophagus sp. K07 TaxID=2283636 RepID=UPI0016525B67|nr:DUF4380 domain-containing protein [Saccharophagus sp. K07]MBC6904468.1 DUF4380 domain-containing protein [Saccharophagus sp. K07]